MRQAEQCPGKKSDFGFAAKVGGWRKENVGFEPARLKKPGCLVGCVKGPGCKRVDGGPVTGAAVLVIQRVEIKSMKIVLQADIMAIETHLRLNELRYAILRRMKKIINIHWAWLCLICFIIVERPQQKEPLQCSGVRILNAHRFGPVRRVCVNRQPQSGD